MDGRANGRKCSTSEPISASETSCIEISGRRCRHRSIAMLPSAYLNLTNPKASHARLAQLPEMPPVQAEEFPLSAKARNRHGVHRFPREPRHDGNLLL
jgi:hypothetical protein